MRDGELASSVHGTIPYGALSELARSVLDEPRVMALTVSERETGVRFAVRVQPRASRSEVCGVHGDALTVRREEK